MGRGPPRGAPPAPGPLTGGLGPCGGARTGRPGMRAGGTRRCARALLCGRAEAPSVRRDPRRPCPPSRAGCPFSAGAPLGRAAAPAPAGCAPALRPSLLCARRSPPCQLPCMHAGGEPAARWPQLGALRRGAHGRHGRGPARGRCARRAPRGARRGPVRRPSDTDHGPRRSPPWKDNQPPGTISCTTREPSPFWVGKGAARPLHALVPRQRRRPARGRTQALS
mmetsp:Transcript_11489/g.39218  ORF Transcript_11489/g.39218 Transcript_11489/m.39218 type:complete len:223 (+) Transcript_11489:832-1500(+)